MSDANEATALVGLNSVFTVFFVTLGPLKILGPFSKQTQAMDQPAMRAVAWRAFALSVLAVLTGGFIGKALLVSWGIPSSALILAGGFVFFVVALNQVVSTPQAAHGSAGELPSAPIVAAMRFTFPTIVTPYGIAALIVLLSKSQSTERMLSVLAILGGIMVMNLLAMLYARRVMSGGLTVISLQVLGAVLGMMQLALAVDMIIHGLRELGVLSASG
jgi:multiple antibiotic resistance protein